MLGICGGGGYAINATMTERRLKAVGTVTGVNYGWLMNEAFSDYAPIAALEAMAAQRTAEARGADLRVDDVLPSSPQDATERGLTEIDLFEATEYYRTPRGQKPNGLNRSLFSHQATAVGWDAFNRAEVLLTQPLMVVVGDKPGAFGAYRTVTKSSAAQPRITRNSSSSTDGRTTTCTTSQSRYPRHLTSSSPFSTRTSEHQ